MCGRYNVWQRFGGTGRAGLSEGGLHPALYLSRSLTHTLSLVLIFYFRLNRISFVVLRAICNTLITMGIYFGQAGVTLRLLRTSHLSQNDVHQMQALIYLGGKEGIDVLKIYLLHHQVKTN